MRQSSSMRSIWAVEKVVRFVNRRMPLDWCDRLGSAGASTLAVGVRHRPSGGDAGDRGDAGKPGGAFAGGEPKDGGRDGRSGKRPLRLPRADESGGNGGRFDRLPPMLCRLSSCMLNELERLRGVGIGGRGGMPCPLQESNAVPFDDPYDARPASLSGMNTGCSCQLEKMILSTLYPSTFSAHPACSCCFWRRTGPG